MIAPTTLIRDTALVGGALTVGGFFVGQGFSVAAGAAAAVLNLSLMILAARGMVAARAPGLHLPIKLLAGVGLAFLLVRTVEPVPALVGFASFVIAIALRGVVGAARPVEA